MMPSPPRRATRSAVPLTGAPALPSGRSQKGTSSSSSSTSGRAQRSAQKSKSVSPALNDDEPVHDDSLADTGSRRSQRTRKLSSGEVLAILNKSRPKPEDITKDDGEDVTRCVCGHDPPLGMSEEDDPWYIQCDFCKVWQHGECVGIPNEDDSPPSYFCELCVPEFHRQSVNAQGERISMCLLPPAPKPKGTTPPPVQEPPAPPSRKTSVSTKTELPPRREREQPHRISLDSTSARGRPTMNSSRTDYDEEEAFRIAIEQSKADNGTKSAGSRKGKRSRADSDVTTDNKRQRTGSGSEGAAPHIAASADMSDNEQGSNKSHHKKAKATATEAQRNKEMREREQVKEQQRQDAANRRKDRAGRRRVDDPEAPEDATPDATATTTTTAPDHPAIDPPQPSPVLPKKSHAKKPKRSGRNQYSAPLEKPTVSPPTKTAQSSSSDDHPTHEDEPPEPSHKGKKWKGKAVKPPPSGDSGKKPEHTIQDMETATQWMLTCISKAGQVDQPHSPGLRMADGQVLTPRSADSGAMSSSDMAEQLRSQILTWRTEFAAGSGLEAAA